MFEVELRLLGSAGVVWLVEKSFHISSLLLCNFACVDPATSLKLAKP